MWTPRRLVLFLLGIAAFTAVFAVYSQFLGRIDGLPPFPEEFFVRRKPDDSDPLPPPRNALIDVKLQRAFGVNCVETSYNHRLELQKNGVILATNQVTIEPDGRCKLKPFSIAVVKDRGPGQEPEVYTTHADEAAILFDEPAKNLADMGKRRIVGCDLISDPSLLSPDPRRHRITCIHNRGTTDGSDDLVLETTGPVQYREIPTATPTVETPQIITTAAVRMVDRRGMPQSTTVTAQGMRIYLMAATTAQPAVGKNRGKTPGGISGVRKVELPEHVTMNLWMDPKDGFLTGGKPSAATTAERNNVQITTQGLFAYEVGETIDKARFEMKPSAGPNDQPGFVQVVRPLIKDGVTLYDRLDCAFLELSFLHNQSKSKDGSTADKTDPGNNLQSVHAWGDYVVITSQAENMQASGNDLLHESSTRRSTLKGKPEVVAIKDGHEIHAPELVLVGSEAKGGQEAFAVGSGWFKGRMSGDQSGPDGPRVLSARWRDQMHYRKEEGQELITLTGAARVEDPERQQVLSGELIKMTLAPDPAATGKPASANMPPMKPRRLEISGRVAAQSPDLIIKDTDQLVVLFREAAPGVVALQEKPSASGVAVSNPKPISPNTVIPSNDRKSAAVKKPFEISAKSVQAFLTSSPAGPTQLDNVNCEGTVKVHQDPTTAQEKPVDMAGDSLQLVHKADGHTLTVIGDMDRPAEVHLPDLSLLGPTVKLDQSENVAEVQGPGSMKIMSTTDFQGNKLAQPTELVISWKQEMHFNGSTARFQGFVQATQENTRLLCHGMQVTLDKEVKFNHNPGKPEQGARAANVKKVICETTGEDGAAPVSVVDSLREGNRMVRYQRIESRELAVFKDEGRFEAPGPGEVRILQLGPKDIAKAQAPNAKAPGSNEEEMKLTYVRYDHKLTVFNESRIAKFWKNVEVLHIPADNPGLHLNLNQLINNLPNKALYLKCDLLTVYTQDKGPKKYHMMVAEQGSTVQFDNFIGQADTIKYNEEQQQVIFEGSPGRSAVLSQLQAKGQKPKIFKGLKFTYNRMTGRFDGNDVISISE